MAAKLEPILTIADLDAIPEDGNRYELIEGELFVSRAPSLKHQFIVSNLHLIFGEYLKQNRIGVVIPGPGVIFSELSGVIPDLAFISNEHLAEIATGERLEGAPELIIEVLSPGPENERRDRQVKRQLYRKYGIKEYWIVDPKKTAVEIYRSPGFKLAKRLSGKQELTSPLLPGFSCLVRDIFVLPLALRKKSSKRRA